MRMDPEVALALKYGAEYEWKKYRGWRRIGVLELSPKRFKYFCVHGCDTMKGPTATLVWNRKSSNGEIHVDAVCDEHAAKAGVPDILLTKPPASGTVIEP